MIQRYLDCSYKYHSISKRMVFLGGAEAPKTNTEKPKDDKTKQAEADQKLSKETGKSLQEIRDYREKYLMPLEKAGLIKMSEGKKLYDPNVLRNQLQLQAASLQEKYNTLTLILKAKANTVIRVKSVRAASEPSPGDLGDNVTAYYNLVLGQEKDAYDAYDLSFKELKDFCKVRNLFEDTLWKLEEVTKHPHHAGAENGPVHYETQKQDFNKDLIERN